MRTSSEAPAIHESPAIHEATTGQKTPLIYGGLVFQGRPPALYQVQDEEHSSRNDEGSK